LFVSRIHFRPINLPNSLECRGRLVIVFFFFFLSFMYSPFFLPAFWFHQGSPTLPFPLFPTRFVFGSLCLPVVSALRICLFFFPTRVTPFFYLVFALTRTDAPFSLGDPALRVIIFPPPPCFFLFPLSPPPPKQLLGFWFCPPFFFSRGGFSSVGFNGYRVRFQARFGNLFFPFSFRSQL